MIKDLVNRNSIEWKFMENMMKLSANDCCESCGEEAIEGGVSYKTDQYGYFPRPNLYKKTFSWNCKSCLRQNR